MSKRMTRGVALERAQALWGTLGYPHTMIRRKSAGRRFVVGYYKGSKFVEMGSGDSFEEAFATALTLRSSLTGPSRSMESR
jgi:hypothetical protein